MVADIGSVVLLENGKIGIVHGFLYEVDQNCLFGLNEYMDTHKIGLEGMDFDGHYWTSNNLNLKVIATSIEDYNNKTTFHHPV